MHRLQHQHPELQHRVKARPAALRGIAAAKRLGQDRPEQLEIHRRPELLQRIAFRRKLLQPFLNVPKPALPRHRLPSRQIRQKTSFRRCPPLEEDIAVGVASVVAFFFATGFQAGYTNWADGSHVLLSVVLLGSPGCLWATVPRGLLGNVARGIRGQRRTSPRAHFAGFSGSWCQGLILALGAPPGPLSPR